MSELVIKSGDSGNTAEVDMANRLRTFSITQKDSVDASVDGDTFFITSGIVNLTSANTSHILFIENGDTVDWVIDQITVSVGPSTGGSGGDLTTNYTVNPTGGTLITGGTATAGLNLNIGSSKPLAGTFITGVEGDTITGGDSVPPGLIVSDQIEDIFSGGFIIVSPGTSSSIGITPPTGNSSMNSHITIILYRKTAAR